MTVTSTTSALDWSALDEKAVNTSRLLAADAVQKVGNGHPGTAMSLAPVAYTLFQKVMRHDPKDTRWVGRDRFVLSAGHSSLTQYVQLYLGGFGLELSDLEALRTWGSKTPGHPEYGHTAGIETTTGPLGQGISNAVGMAMAARRERGLFDPDAAPGESPFDHRVYVICSEGDLEEGVSGEASSIAGTQQLGNLIVIYDENEISIEDDTVIAFNEDVAQRYEAYGWHVQTLDWRRPGQDYVEDVAGLYDAIIAAQAVTDKPSFIRLRTIIGWPAPNKQGTGGVHGSAMGEDEVRATKEVLGFDPDRHFAVDTDVLAHTRDLVTRGEAARAAWQHDFDRWAAANPQRKALFDRLAARELPAGWEDALPTFAADPKGIATRAASGKVLSALAPVMPELWGGSADLAGSNNTTPDGQPSFLPENRQSKKFRGDPYGRVLHFGIREHAMGAILNGIATHGDTRIYGGTFFVFADYMRGAVRLAALMKLPVTYVWTHDSIGVGEDGPTHQPIEHLAAYRAIIGLDVVRPADANETVQAWAQILRHHDRPAGLVLSRQNLPIVPRGTDGYAEATGVARGGYVLKDCEGTPDVILIGTGSEVQYALTAQERLGAEGVKARVVSMPCREWFDEQDDAYRDAVLPTDVRARVAVEAGIALGWSELVGDAGRIVSLDHYGASAAGGLLFEKFGLTPEAVVAAAQESLAAVAAGPTLTNRRAACGPARLGA
ncbi:transketolase [Raineyella sp.]|uniref:transketolase n=1 Tax=bioreactor metagenome TaxID=1076179 RepID=A0A644YVN5_9ZZZZ|nr:transketolase [Raineyella sp.]MEA5155930.1 transketolase [Raineyella sp.]